MELSLSKCWSLLLSRILLNMPLRSLFLTFYQKFKMPHVWTWCGKFVPYYNYQPVCQIWCCYQKMHNGLICCPTIHWSSRCEIAHTMSVIRGVFDNLFTYACSCFLRDIIKRYVWQPIGIIFVSFLTFLEGTRREKTNEGLKEIQ